MGRARLRMIVTSGTVLAVIAAMAPAAAAVQDPTGTPSDASLVDSRQDSVRPTAAQVAGVNRITAGAGAGTRVTWDGRFGTPRTIRIESGWLTGPNAGSAAEVARAWIGANRDALGLSDADVAALVVTRDHELTGTGTRVVNFAQTAGGLLAVRGGRLGVAVTSDGRILSYAGSSARGGPLTGVYQLSAADALVRTAGGVAPGVAFTPTVVGERAGFQVFDKGAFAAGSYVRKVAFPTAAGLRPAYQVLFVQALDRAWESVIDGGTGALLYRQSLVDNDAEGTVYENFPGAPRGGQPVIRPFGPNPQSPGGYVDPTGLAGVPGPTTFGNNANTYANWSNFEGPVDQGPRPVSPTSQFNYSYANNWNRTNGQAVPPSYALDVDPAATNLFWQHNRIHDEYYALGFTETAGNFQVDNFGAGGSGGDPVLGLVQAGAASGGAPTYTGRDNAYMLTLPDGIPPWSGMFLWEPINDAFEGPYADGSFDAGVVQHEYTHGLTNRYVGQQDNALGTQQSGSMGEGWSDWYALNHLSNAGLLTKAVLGEYVTGNATRGIRNWNYDENPAGFGDIGYDLGGAEVHSDGEIWTAMLWDVRKALVARYGSALGSDIAARIGTDAMPLSPDNPSFVDMRDAIVTALANRYHGRPDYAALADLVYAAFAKRGLGAQASSQGGDDIDPVPSFEHRNPARNGTLTGTVVNAATGKPVAGARVIVGVLEARVTPLRKTSSTGGFSAPVVAGTYPVTIQAPGFGARTFTGVKVAEGRTTGLTFKLAPNLASSANGAAIVSASAPNAGALIDDTEASTWQAARGSGNAVIRLAAPERITSVQVSAFTTSRFEGLRGFTLQTSTDGVNWRTALAPADAFGFAAPRPTAPDLHYKTFKLATPMTAAYVRFWTDTPQGETKADVQAAEVQVFSTTADGVEPLPPAPPDPPVTDSGTIAAPNPSTGQLDDTTGVTATSLRSTCAAPPPAQGADGWVTALPDSFGDGVHKVAVKGSSAAPYDLDLYFYNAACELIGSAASGAVDEAGTLPSGTKYVLTQLWLGAALPFTLTATDTA